jgi:GAF domain-containing protein
MGTSTSPPDPHTDASSDATALLDVRILRDLAAIVLAHEDLGAVLDRVARLAQEVVPGADEVSLTLIRDEKPATVAHTGPLALDVDELQYERGHGPCMDAGRAGMVLLTDDMRTESRWPDYTAAAAEHGALSSLSLPLPVQDQFIGAVNMYARSPHAFTPAAVAVGQTVAAYAAVAVANAHAYAEAAARAHHMQEAMRSRAVIEQAKGIVMAQQRCSPDDAFTLLSRASQRANRKLRDLAADVVAQASGAPAPGRDDGA